MAQLRISIVWRLITWFVILSLVPVGVVIVFTQRQIRENVINTQLEIMRDHARLYATRMRADPGKESEIAFDMMNTTNGDTFYLIASNGTYLASSNYEKIGRSALQDFSFETLQNLLAQESTAILDEENGHVIGSYRASLTQPLAVSVGNIAQKTLTLSSLPRNLLIQLSIALILASIIAGVVTSSVISNPLKKLTDFSNEIKKGRLNAAFEPQKLRGEFAEMASNLQTLAVNTRASFASMENKVEERTLQLERRSNLLKAVADVGKAITSFRNLSELLEKTTHLINENFGYYHAGIFLLDSYKEYAVLSAANSEGGQRMLKRKHQLQIGGNSIVGFVTQNAKARIALDVGADAVYFDNPDLPETRSEMALPLIVGGQILGALDVQSVEAQAFTEEDISTLQILAEQLAVAIQNANLLSETEKALESARLVYGEMSREAWSNILRNQPLIGFLATPPGTAQMRSDTLEAHLAKAFETGDVVLGSDNLTISIPIKIRGQSIGAIRLKKAEIAEAWTQDETNLAIALADQLSGALESARLYKESQRRAARESLVSDISARISAASHTDAILRETVQELGQTFGNASVTFQLLEEFSEEKQIEIQEREYAVNADRKARE
ncbi:MAG: GAF domain-containing protein [Anaerolineales bacterium]|nr:GAF domain-containing protein [Anaerolineales bacterium]